ncbi:hypothetical protein [Streptomyces sp. NPDC101249]|uniref:hypothetical protein n=1 Tax=Streptomyces sp. NPDC101249 TaxID=3366140 RepID=UPI003823B39B
MADARADDDADAAVDDLVAAFPALAGLVRPAVLLRPEPGAPGVLDSSVGGPLLWPAAEPWPVCREAHAVEVRVKVPDGDRAALEGVDRAVRDRRRARPERAEETTAEESAVLRRVLAGAEALDRISWETVRTVWDTSGPGVAMVPLLQLRHPRASAAAGRPRTGRPEGADLLQVLWCPNDHGELPDQSGYHGPAVEIRRRTAARVARDRVLTSPPRPDRAEDAYLPTPFLLSPQPVADLADPDGLPDPDDLPAALAEEARRWAGRRGAGAVPLNVPSLRPGWKLGGWPGRDLSGPDSLDCVSCGAPTRLLLTVPSSVDGPDISVGRFGTLRVHTCPEDGRHPARLHLQ